MVVERVKTGIYGLDELLEGGFPKNRTILVAGACGTGKSILAMQYAFRGAAEFGEPAVFVTFDEMPEKLRQDMLNFGWNVKSLEEKKKFAIVDGTSAKAGTPSEEEHSILPGQADIDRVLIDVITVARDLGAKRLVLDSIPAMASRIQDPNEVRKTILKLAYVISRAGITAVLTTEIPEQSLGTGSMTFSKYDVEEYVSDGVILVNFLGIGTQASRTIYIRKMRGTKHATDIHPMDITEKGITVKKIDEVFK